MLHVHKRKLEEFMQDSNMQWDSDDYVTNRYSRTRYPQSLFVTPEIQRNIEQSNGEDGGNAPRSNRSAPPDKMSINELQLHLSNQAAVLRRNMSNEYEELREFQNNELKLLIQAKASKEPWFKTLAEDARKNPPRTLAHSTPKLPRRESQQAVQPPRLQNIPARIASPVLVQSPAEYPDLQALIDDPALSPFFKFFLHLRVIQQNWPAVSHGWSQYINLFHRKLMPEKAFTKGVLEDAVRGNVAYHFRPDREGINSTRGMAQTLPDQYIMSRLIIDVILEMAEAGLIEHSMAPSESKGEIFGPTIILDAMALERKLLENTEKETESKETVKKATDPRSR